MTQSKYKDSYIYCIKTYVRTYICICVCVFVLLMLLKTAYFELVKYVSFFRYCSPT